MNNRTALSHNKYLVAVKGKRRSYFITGSNSAPRTCIIGRKKAQKGLSFLLLNKAPKLRFPKPNFVPFAPFCGHLIEAYAR
jgi:hypothetical protein